MKTLVVLLSLALSAAVGVGVVELLNSPAVVLAMAVLS